jgi:uncharacterized protein YbjT (DUF2867 family)
VVSIAVTGASGAVGKRVVQLLAAREIAEKIVAIDRRRPPRSEPLIEGHQLDLTSDDLVPALQGCDSVVHLAEDPARRADLSAAVATLDRVLVAAENAGCGHLVLLSSALVYGAHPDNPVPMTEAQPVRPIPTLAHATIKAGLEARAAEWADGAGSKVAVLRPTATLSDGDSSWIGAALRAATAVRSEAQRLDSVYNVAPDGWIGAELFRALRGEADVRLPQQLSEWRLRAAKSLANRSLLDGLEPYVSWPWVVANDKLRSTGWEPQFSNEEAFVAGTPPPLLASIDQQRRQEIALGVAGTAGAAALGAALWLARKTVK